MTRMALDFPSDFPFHRPSAQDKKQQVAPAGAALAAASGEPTPHVVMSPARPRPAAERRRAPRQTLVAKACIRPDTAVQMASLNSTGFVSNISMNGVGFHTRKPLAIGEKYRITLELGPMKWSSRMRIVSCLHHPDSETFDIGAEFVGNELSRHLQAA